MKIFSRFVDERFLAHRQRSTMLGGQAGGLTAIGLFLYRYFADHVWSWDLLAVGATIGGVKLIAMIWFMRSE